MLLVPVILQKMMTNSTQLTGCQVGHVDLVGKSNVCGIMVEGVAISKPIEVEGEVLNLES